jgi:uncharacterized protein DUF1918
MRQLRPLAKARKGDLVAVHGHHLGESERLGEILEVLGGPDRIHFRVRWEDERESVFYPGSDATIRAQRSKSVQT